MPPGHGFVGKASVSTLSSVSERFKTNTAKREASVYASLLTLNLSKVPRYHLQSWALYSNGNSSVSSSCCQGSFVSLDLRLAYGIPSRYVSTPCPNREAFVTYWLESGDFSRLGRHIVNENASVNLCAEVIIELTPKTSKHLCFT